jgi:ectoine hydroxylase-related dioxygenase (phytanoyl-CoA dioxygenase family)
LASGFHEHGLIGKEWEPLSEDQFAGANYIAVEAAPGDAVFFDSFAPHRSGPNNTDGPRRVLYYTYNKASEGDHLAQYYADKRESYPPDIEREAGKEYVYRV